MGADNSGGRSRAFSRWVFMLRLGYEAGNLALAGGLLYLLFLWACLQLGPDQLAVFFQSGLIIMPALLALDFLIGLFLFLPIFRGLEPLAQGRPMETAEALALWTRLARFPVQAVKVSLPMWLFGTAVAGWWMVRNQAMPGPQALLTFPGCALLGISTSVIYYFRARIIIRPIIRLAAERLPADFAPAARRSLFPKTFAPVIIIILALTLCLSVMAWLWRVQGRRETGLGAARAIIARAAAESSRVPQPWQPVHDFELFTVRPFLADFRGAVSLGEVSGAEREFITRHQRLLGRARWEQTDPLRGELTALLERVMPLPEDADADPGGPKSGAAVWPWAAKTVVLQREPAPGGYYAGAVIEWKPGARFAAETRAYHSALLPAFALIIMAITGLYAFWFASDLNAPLAALRRAMALGFEDRSGRRALVDSSDEFGALTGTFNQMSLLLSGQMERSAAVLEGVKSSVARLSETMNRIVQVVAEQSSGSSEHAVTIQQISSTSEEMAATLRLIAESAKSVDEVAGRTLDACHQGQRHLGEVSDGIAAAMARAQQVAEKMLYFQEQASRIEEILELMTDISERINLIALNASIEASAFGEAGDRFAIVARQMRDLAEKTMEGAQQIRRIFADLQSATAGAIIATEEGEKQVAATRGLADRAADDFQAIVHWAGETARSSQEIAFSSNQQTSATDHFATALADIRDVAGKIADTAKVLEAAVNELDNTGYQLNYLIRGSGPGPEMGRDKEDGDDQQRVESEGA